MQLRLGASQLKELVSGLSEAIKPGKEEYFLAFIVKPADPSVRGTAEQCKGLLRALENFATTLEAEGAKFSLEVILEIAAIHKRTDAIAERAKEVVEALQRAAQKNARQ